MNLVVAGCLNAGDHKGGFRTEPGEHLVVGAPQSANYKGDSGCDDSKLVVASSEPTRQSRNEPTSDTFIVQPYNIIGSAQTSQNHAYPADCTGVIQQKGNPASLPESGTVICFQERQRDGYGNLEISGDTASARESAGRSKAAERKVAYRNRVRRLTPTECLRLMGAPDDYLDLAPPLSDTAKYSLCGNGVVVPVAEWIARRLVAVATPILTGNLS